MDSLNIWQREVLETYNINSRNVNYPRIVKCDRCKCYSYRYVDARNCRVCSS